MAEENELNERFEEFRWRSVQRSRIPPGFERCVERRMTELAKELAKSGYDLGLWQFVGKWLGAGAPHEFNICVRRYFMERWDIWCQFHESVSRLNRHDYTVTGEIYEELTNAAFALLEEPEDTQSRDSSDSYDGFISYRRSESSLLALLARTTLQLHQFAPFIDLELNPDHDEMAREAYSQRVRSSSYFVSLKLGRTTLSISRFAAVRELHWAILVLCSR